MAVFTVISHQRLDDYAVVQTLTGTDIEVGQSITLAGLGYDLNGTHVVLDCPQYEFTGVQNNTGELTFNPEVARPNQLLFRDAGADLDFTAAIPTGTCTWQLTCTWVNATDIEDYVGIGTASMDEAAFLTQCAAACSAFAYRRRYEAGYLQDSLTTVPSADVKLGTIMIGAAYFRQKGSFNTIATFDGMGAPPSTGVTPMVMQLLGINRPQVA
jgi:hypothetical protein